MDESLRYLRERFHIKEQDIRTYSPLTLAYIGDAAYEMVVRSILVMRGNVPVHVLHQQASRLVKAPYQSAAMEVLEPLLTEEESAVYRRGRNAHSATTAKHATVMEYRRATGFEAVMGYLYLKGDWQRMIDLAEKGIKEGGKKHE